MAQKKKTKDVHVHYDYAVAGPAVICTLSVQSKDFGSLVFKGKAVCKKNDIFDECTGKLLARRAATEMAYKRINQIIADYNRDIQMTSQQIVALTEIGEAIHKYRHEKDFDYPKTVAPVETTPVTLIEPTAPVEPTLIAVPPCNDCPDANAGTGWIGGINTTTDEAKS